jgi:hypothetical protein
MENTEREKKIIQQAKSYLVGDSIYNSGRLQDKIDKAIEINTVDAFWSLQKILHKGGEFTQRLVDYKGVSDALVYTNELAAILRGERLEQN